MPEKLLHMLHEIHKYKNYPNKVTFFYNNAYKS